MPRLTGRVAVALLLLVLLQTVPAMAQGRPIALYGALINQAAGRIDDALTATAASTRALTATYRTLAKTAPAVTAKDRAHWLQHRSHQGNTVGFDEQTPEPAAMAPLPAYYCYNGTHVTDENVRELGIMQRLAPALAAAHDALPFSWVYLTTPAQTFVIYPYLPLAEAVHNERPTDQNFYTAADFKKKACGWESPYFDLAGAGMMVTVSCPAYAGETLLGVVSRDITLHQLSATVLADLAAVVPDARAVLINRRGKAIAASDPKTAAAISEGNAKAKDAVVYFRADRGLTALNLEKGVSSPDEAMNAAVESVLERAAAKHGWPLVLTQGRDTVLAERIKTTGWYLVLLMPTKTIQ